MAKVAVNGTWFGLSDESVEDFQREITELKAGQFTVFEFDAPDESRSLWVKIPAEAVVIIDRG